MKMGISEILSARISDSVMRRGRRMAYEAETVAYSQKIFYYLLCHGALSDIDTGVNELYRAYVEHEEVMNLVKNQAEFARCV